MTPYLPLTLSGTLGSFTAIEIDLILRYQISIFLDFHVMVYCSVSFWIEFLQLKLIFEVEIKLLLRINSGSNNRLTFYYILDIKDLVNCFYNWYIFFMYYSFITLLYFCNMDLQSCFTALYCELFISIKTVCKLKKKIDKCTHFFTQVR